MEEKQIQIPDVNADAEERDNYTLIQETPEDNLSGESGIAIRYSKDFNIVQANELSRWAGRRFETWQVLPSPRASLAAAEPPFRLPEQVVDRAGVLDAAAVRPATCGERR